MGDELATQDGSEVVLPELDPVIEGRKRALREELLCGLVGTSPESTVTPKEKWMSRDVRMLSPETAWSAAKAARVPCDVGVTVEAGNLLLTGMSVERARSTIGITKRQWDQWVRRGIQDEQPYDVFAYVVNCSLAILEMRATSAWTKAFDRDWRAAKAYLQSSNPDVWDKSSTLIDKETQHTVNNNTTNVVLTTTELLQVADILRAQGCLPQPSQTDGTSLPSAPPVDGGVDDAEIVEDEAED